jgi:CBS domain containing-hemolysin-like protein
MLWIGLILAILVLVITSTIGFTLRSPSRVRIGDLLSKNDRQAELERLIQNLPRLMLASGALRSSSFVAVTLLVFVLFSRTGVESAWVLWGGAFAIAWGLILVFGLAIPTAWARYAGEPWLAAMLPSLQLLGRALYPLVNFLHIFDGLVRRLSGVPLQTARSQADELEREILSVVSEGELRGAVDEEEKEMIESIIDLRDTQVEEIMTPRTEVIAVAKGTALADVKQLIADSGHSRIPVYEETIDRVLGMLYAKDLLHIDPDVEFDITQIMRAVQFIPETKTLRSLLREFQAKKVHIAVVLDEYGGTAGLVTIEDILEELVGEIVDEYESDEPQPIRRLDEHTVEVDARMRIDDLNDELNIQLSEEEDYETIGGLVFTTMGKIPKVGERCQLDNVGIQVIAAEPRRVTRLRLELAGKDGMEKPGSE